MSKIGFVSSLLLGVVACAEPKGASSDAPPDTAALQARIDGLESKVGHLESRIDHLKTEIAAASAEDELTAMTIDSVSWPDDPAAVSETFGAKTALLCHVVEWRGYGKMLRFIRKADPVFRLEAEGHPALDATIVTGGICNSDGSTRLAVLSVSGVPDPSARYRLRPRNENDGYRWSVSDDLVVTPR